MNTLFNQEIKQVIKKYELSFKAEKPTFWGMKEKKEKK